jgi:hypothetical protein
LGRRKLCLRTVYQSVTILKYGSLVKRGILAQIGKCLPKTNSLHAQPSPPPESWHYPQPLPLYSRAVVLEEDRMSLGMGSCSGQRFGRLGPLGKTCWVDHLRVRQCRSLGSCRRMQLHGLGTIRVEERLHRLLWAIEYGWWLLACRHLGRLVRCVGKYGVLDILRGRVERY